MKTQAVLRFVLLFAFCPVLDALQDDWYSVASFQDPNWANTYEYTCDYKFDLFREPREYTKRNELQGRREVLSPIKFLSKDAVRAPENHTLHIYNNPGTAKTATLCYKLCIRKGYSVSYAFSRDKECIHGEDAECFVNPELGRIRALVVNADRFGGRRNLNFLKDHFLIERPEQYVTIINGGSTYERKFYEAVFLGGYTDEPGDPTRSSHSIDGKTYPLEIYMYFLDETVPSVSLATILVVLVEESDRDNKHIKPIIQAIENRLYNQERRFLDRNKALIRRERLFHHLGASTYYDVFDTNNLKQEHVLQESLEAAIKFESLFSRYVEPFERMQALDAELYLLLEDLDLASDDLMRYAKFVQDFMDRKGNTLFPANFTEFQLMAFVSITRGVIEARKPSQVLGKNLSCAEYTDHMIRKGEIWTAYPWFFQFKNVSQLPTNANHMDKYVDLVTQLCEHFDTKFVDTFLENKNHYVHHMREADKLDLIQAFAEERKERDGNLNKLVLKHYQDKALHPYARGDEIPEYANVQQRNHIVTGIAKLFHYQAKLSGYETVIKNLKRRIDDIAHRLDYKDQEEMEGVIHYLKHGSTHSSLKFHRSKLYNDYIDRNLPTQKQKRTAVEMGGMEIAEEKIKEYEDLEPVKATVDQSFQISWLIPKDGGYYYYAGSSPVPPCFRAQNVIVFKRPIKMSKRQIEYLTKVPTSFNRNEDILATTPKIHDTHFEVELSGLDTEQSRVEEFTVPVYHQPRNHLFLGHDGVHKNSVEEWDKVRAAEEAARTAKANVGKVIPNKKCYFALSLIVLFVI